MGIFTSSVRRGSTRISCVVACLAFATVGSAAPTTKPATRPAARPATKPATRPANTANTNELESKSFGLKFRVPKNWKRLTLRSGDPDSIFAFQLPITASGNGTGSPVLKQFHIFLGLGYKGDPSMDNVAKIVRESIQKDGAANFTQDAAIDFAGKSAWAFTWNAVQTVQVTESSGGKSNVRKEELKIIKHMVVWPQDGKLCEVGYDVGAEDGAATEKLVSAVRDSFQWTTAP